MLYFTVTDSNTGLHSEHTWHVGEQTYSACASYVSSVQADGDELDYIKETMLHLPMRRDKSVVSWYGDHAKFIIANLS